MLSFIDSARLHALWVGILLALVPAALNWWWTRKLHTGDTPALPERHMAHVQRVSAVASFCGVTIGIVALWNALWLAPLELLALTCTTYRTRRALLGETWPLHRFLLWRLRMFCGVWAYWIFVALAPAVVANVTPALQWWTAGLIFIVAVAWQRWYMRVLLIV